MRLLPLRHIEALLIAKLVPPNEDEATDYGFSPSYRYHGNGKGKETDYGGATGFGWGGIGGGGGVGVGGIQESRRHREVFVRAGVSWKGALAKGKTTTTNGRPHSAGVAIDIQDEPTAVLYACRNDLLDLWHDHEVRDILKKRKIRLEEQPGL